MAKQVTRILKYSPREQAVLSALKSGKKLTSTELIEAVYNGDRPISARNSVHTLVNILMRKVERNREPFRIVKTKTRLGPVPSEFWKEKR